jgi:hypothetical protein
VRKCGCGEVFGFNFELVKEDTALRSFIRKNKIGWNRKKINVLNGQRLGSRIKRSAIRIDVLYQLDKKPMATTNIKVLNFTHCILAIFIVSIATS